MAHTFILTSDQGVPVFLYWTPGPDGLMTPVVNYLTMAPGRDEMNDLLFLGGQVLYYTVLYCTVLYCTVGRPGTRTSMGCRGSSGSSCWWWRTTRPGSRRINLVIFAS